MTEFSFPLMASPPSKHFSDLLKGAKVKCQLRCPNEKPEWLNEARFERGRSVFFSHTMGIFMSNFRNLILGLSISPMTQILWATNRSCDAATARKRYTDTGFYIWAWYASPPPWENSEPWEKVNRMHKDAETKYLDGRIEFLRESTSVPLSEEDQWWLNELRLARKAAQEAGEDFSDYKHYRDIDIPFSQFDMALVQIAFYSFICHPSSFGSHFVSAKELLDLAYFWRVAGYYLGLDDRYNVVSCDNLEEIKSLVREVSLRIVLPAILMEDDHDEDLGPLGLVMAEAVCQGFNASYMLILYSHIEVLYGVRLTLLWQTFGWRRRLIYWTRTVVLEWLLALPPLRWLMNKVTSYTLNRMYGARLDKLLSSK